MDNTVPAHAAAKHTLIWQQPVWLWGCVLTLFAIGLLGWQYNASLDVTHNQRNTLSTASITLLSQMPAPIHIEAFCSNSPYKGRYFRKSVQSLIQRYQRHHSAFDLTFVDPVNEPARARAMHIKKEGELVVSYQGQQAHLYLPYTEEALSNLLLRLKHGQAAPLIFIEGQQAPSLNDDGPYGASQLKLALQQAGVPTLQTQALPDVRYPLSHTLVLAGAAQPYPAAFVESVQSHVQRGGNLVWVVDQAQTAGLQALAKQLGISISAGIAVDPTNLAFDLPPHVLGSQHYASQGATEDFALRTFFDEAHQITALASSQPYWQVTPLIAVADHGWLSAHYQAGQRQTPVFQPNTDQIGPITVALSLLHVRDDGSSQRILIIGSRHAMHNVQLTRGGNLAMAVKLLQWVRNTQPVISLTALPLRDAVVVLPEQSWEKNALICLFSGYQFALPLVLAGIGGWIGYRRKRI